MIFQWLTLDLIFRQQIKTSVKSQIPPLLYEKPEMYKPKNLHRYKNNDFIDFEQRRFEDQRFSPVFVDTRVNAYSS